MEKVHVIPNWNGKGTCNTKLEWKGTCNTKLEWKGTCNTKLEWKEVM